MNQPVATRMRRKKERPAEILDAAFEEFVRHGFAATRLEDVAKLAGVTKGTIYFYFETKEHVFEAMIRHKAQPVFAQLTDFIATLDGSYIERLRSLIAFIYTTMTQNRTNRETMRFLIAEGRRFPSLVDRHATEILDPFIEQVRLLLTQGVEAGEFRNTPLLKYPEIVLSPAMLMDVMWLLFDERRPISVQDFIDVHLDLLMNGLAAKR
jgi:AcrR family transcriptional regulator